MNRFSRCKPYLGTYVELQLIADESDDTLIDMSNAAFEKTAYIEQLMSFHNPESELSAVNRECHLTTCAISSELQYVLEQSLQLSRLTRGAFDVSIAGELVKQGMRPNVGVSVDPEANWQAIQLSGNLLSFSRPLLIDLGGIAKGYAVDQVLALFDSKVEVVVNAGGDLAMSHWQNQSVAIRHPALPHRMADVPMQNRALATSAAYFHNGDADIISPLTKRPVSDSRSISVFAETCLIADALTKVAFLYKDSEWLLKKLAATAVAITPSGELLSVGMAA